jgi:DNA-binding HxlR family transcriptional regulator
MRSTVTRRSLLVALLAGLKALSWRRMERIDRLTSLFRRRWACPVIAELHRSEGAKFVSLVHKLSSSPGAMRQALEELIELGWIRRNPGYGHPLRPEYILTRAGERIAPACSDLDAAIDLLSLEDVALRKWSMPALHAIGEGPTRFTRIVRALPGATDRAISLTLKDLGSSAIVERKLVTGPPIGSVYAAAPTGMRLLPILDRL